MQGLSRFLHPQQRQNTCAVAAVRTVLHYQFNVRITEPALIALGTRPSSHIVKEGSDTQHIRRMVRGASAAFNAEKPWTLRVRRHGTLKQLAYWTRHGRWPIVQVYIDEIQDLFSHAIVVLSVTKDRVWYFDPGDTIPRSMSHEKFFAWWQWPSTGERWWSVINGGVLVPADR